MNRRTVYTSIQALGAAIALVLATPSWAQTSPPKSEPTNVDHQIDLVREAFRTYLDASTSRDRSLDDEVRAMCDSLAETLVLDTLGPSAAQFERRAVLLAIEGVTSPLIDLAVAVALDQAPVEESPMGDKQKPEARFDSAMAAMVNGTPRAPTILIYEGADATAIWAGREGDDKLHHKALALRSRSLVELIKERGLAGAGGKPNPLDLRMITRLVTHELEQLPPDLRSTFVNSLLGQSNVHPYLREFALGQADLQTGWDERGSGTISTVGKDNYESFKKRLTSAYGHLREAWKIDPSLPDAPTALISVAMAGVAEERDPVMTWFERATKAQYNHKAAYTAVVQALMPRWGGSAEELDAFGARCIEQGRFETGIPGVYLDCLLAIAREFRDLRWLEDPRVSRRLDDMEKGFRAAKNDAWTGRINSWRMLAALASDDFSRLASVPDPAAFDMDRSIFSRLRINSVRMGRLLWAHTGPTAGEVSKADALVRARKFDEAAKAYAAILTKLESESSPFERRMALRDLVARAEQTAAFERGEWVEPRTEVALPGWEMATGAWRPLTSTRGATGAPTVYAPTLRVLPDPGMRCEASANFATDNQKSELAAVGFEIGLHTEPDRERKVAVLWYRSRHRIEVRTTASSSPIAILDLPAVASGSGKATKDKTWSSIDLRVIVWDEDIGIFANDTPLGRVTIPPNIAAELGAGLTVGCIHSPSTRDDITVKSPRFRRLTARPSELNSLPTGTASAPPSTANPKRSDPGAPAPKDAKPAGTKPKTTPPTKRPSGNGGTP